MRRRRIATVARRVLVRRFPFHRCWCWWTRGRLWPISDTSETLGEQQGKGSREQGGSAWLWRERKGQTESNTWMGTGAMPPLLALAL